MTSEFSILNHFEGIHRCPQFRQTYVKHADFKTRTEASCGVISEENWVLSELGLGLCAQSDEL